MRMLEEQLDRLGSNHPPGLKVTFADAAGSDLPTDAPGGGDGGTGEPPKELTKLERKALFEAGRAAKGGEEKKKKPTKDERREEQSQQRKAKGLEEDVVEEPVAPPSVVRTPSMSKMIEGDAAKGSSGQRLQHDDPKAMAKAKRNQALLRTEVQKKVPWFQHLPQYEREASLSARLTQRADGDIHPEVLKLGLKFAEWMIVGGNARTRTMLMAFSRVVADYSPPKDHETGADVSRHLDGRLKPMISYLVACRPLSIGMGNAIRCAPSPATTVWLRQVMAPSGHACWPRLRI